MQDLLRRCHSDLDGIQIGQFKQNAATLPFGSYGSDERRLRAFVIVPARRPALSVSSRSTPARSSPRSIVGEVIQIASSRLEVQINVFGRRLRGQRSRPRRSPSLRVFFVGVLLIEVGMLRSGLVQIVVGSSSRMIDLFLIGIQHANIQRQRLQLLDKHLEALRHAGGGDVGAFDDGFVGLDAAYDVVGSSRSGSPAGCCAAP